MRNRWLPWLLALLGGALLWGSLALTTTRRELWDDPRYWTTIYPLVMVLCGVLGWIFPTGAWRWGAVVVYAQLGVLVFQGGDFGLLPVAVVLLGLLAVPPVSMAWVGGLLRRRRGG